MGETGNEHTHKTQCSGWTIKKTEAGKEGKGRLEEGLPCREGSLPEKVATSGPGSEGEEEVSRVGPGIGMFQAVRGPVYGPRY